MEPNVKKIVIGVVAAVVLIGIVVAGLLWNSSPRRTIDAFLTAVEAGDTEKAHSFASTTVREDFLDNLEFFIDDWTYEGGAVTTFDRDESWRTKLLWEDGSKDSPALNEYGFQAKEEPPTPKLFAHHYRAYVTVSFDEFEDPVQIKLKRKTENQRNIFSQLFRGWEITNIKYQPLTDEELAEFDDEFLDDFELDVDGLEDGDEITLDPEDFGIEDLDIEDDDLVIDLEEDGTLDLTDDEEDSETTDEDTGTTDVE